MIDDKTFEMVSKTLKEIEQTAEDDYYQFVTSGERKYVAALEEILPKEQYPDLYGRTLSEYLEHYHEMSRGASAVGNGVNRPIAEVLKDFVNPKSKRRSAAREELHRRFDGLDWAVQKDILSAMVQMRTRTDAEWVCERLMDNKDWGSGWQATSELAGEGLDFDLKVLLMCKDMARYPAVANFIVQSYDDPLILQLAEDIEKAIGYRKLCLRLAMYPNYEIDRDKLSLTEYLDVLAQTGRVVAEKDVQRELKIWFGALNQRHVFWNRGLSVRQNEDGRYDYRISLADMHDMRWIIRSCGSLHLPETIQVLYLVDKEALGRLNDAIGNESGVMCLPTDLYRIEDEIRNMFIGYAMDAAEKYFEV